MWEKESYGQSFIEGDYTARIKEMDTGLVAWTVHFKGRRIENMNTSGKGYAQSEGQAKRFCEQVINRHKKEG